MIELGNEYEAGKGRCAVCHSGFFADGMFPLINADDCLIYGDYKNVCGKLRYFIKSDYSPRVFLQQYKEEYKDTIRKATKGTYSEIKEKYIKQGKEP